VRAKQLPLWKVVDHRLWAAARGFTIVSTFLLCVIVTSKHAAARSDDYLFEE
jgi:hypothetical protein